MTSMDPRAAHGVMSPPATGKMTLTYLQPHVAASPVRSQVSSPMPRADNQMAMFQPGFQYDSPAPMQVSPYPTPSSQSTLVAPAGFDPVQWAQFQEFQRMQQQQAFTQPPSNMPPPTPFQPQMPQYAPQPPQRDSGYGSGMYENLGQTHGLPGQHTQASNTRPGHTYGKVTAKGNARIIRGNARDSTRPIMNERQHQYSEAEVDGDADMFDGDVTTEQMREFYLRRQI